VWADVTVALAAFLQEKMEGSWRNPLWGVAEEGQRNLLQIFSYEFRVDSCPGILQISRPVKAHKK